MNAKRGFTLVLILALFALALTACGGKTGDASDKATPTPTEAPTPTETPTPTEAPKTPEQLDKAAIDLFFETAAVMAEGADFPLEEGAKFILKFENDEAVIELESEKAYQMRAWESWVHMTDFPKGRYTMQTEQLAKDGAYGTITGSLNADGTISWVSDNINGGLYDYISAKGVTQDPDYLARVEESKALLGEWNTDVQLPFQTIIDESVDRNDKELLQYYKNLISLLKKNGFTGSMPVSVKCYFMSEKELLFTFYIDWTNFLSAIDRCTDTPDHMLNFLSTIIGASQSAVKTAVKNEGTDIMTFGSGVVYSLKLMCQENPGISIQGSYTIKGDTIYFTNGKYNDKMTYDRKKSTLIYTDLGIECKLKKTE